MNDTYKASATFAYMPVLCEVDNLKGNTGQFELLRAFCDAMKADDEKVKYAHSGAELESRPSTFERRGNTIKKTYHSVVDAFRTIFEGGSPGLKKTKSGQSEDSRGGGPQGSNMDLIANPMFSLETLLRADSKQAKSANEKSQMIRFFDQEARIYLIHLNRQISDYEGNSIKYKDKGYEAPFRIESQQAKRNFKMTQEIFRSNAKNLGGSTFMEQTV